MTTWHHHTALSASRQIVDKFDTNSSSYLDKLWFIRDAGFLSDIEPSQRSALFKLGEMRSFNKDQSIFRAGAPGDTVFLLLSGRVKIYQLSSVGKEVILWFSFPGEIFGLAEILKGRHRGVYAQACSEVQVLAIGHNAFKKFLQDNPSAATSVIDLLSCRLRELSEILVDVSADDVSTRVIKLITRLSARYGKRCGNEINLDIPLTHQEMADMIGTSRQTVTEVLGHLKRQGVLRIENRTIFIQDQEWIGNIIGQ